ncbi:hypothetical protein AAF712_015970 [Marasmius tenuissimus]|uniref:Uncharacterized protein n=1 Tax=Marasmius tenuissimus TaxID=585030 RepID=A0ABR2Z909_9AGAR
MRLCARTVTKFSIESATPLPSTIGISQPVTVGWNWQGNADVFNFELLYLNGDSKPSFTQVLVTDVTVSLQSDGIQRDAVTFSVLEAG